MSSIERPAVLTGATYKLRAAHIKHAIYVTINDVALKVRVEELCTDFPWPRRK